MRLTPDNPHDDWLWLEDIHGEKPLDWVEKQNELTRAEFTDTRTRALAEQLREALDDDDRIPFVSKAGDWLYNFWQDADHPRGLWRRTTWESYQAGRDNAAATEWDILLDIDALAAEENTEWVFRGARLRRSDYARALIALSPDGGDAVAHREFDLPSKSFVEDGFDLPAAKGSASWVDDDTLALTTDFGEDSMTESSYPATARILKRGHSLDEAQQIGEVDRSHILAAVGVDHTPGWERMVFVDAIDFYRSRLWVRPLDVGSDYTAGWQLIDVPDDVVVDIDRDLLLLRPRADWAGATSNGTEFHVPAGALAAVKLDDFLAGAAPRVIFEPTASTSLQGWAVTQDFLVLSLMEHVQSTLRALRLDDFSDVPAPAAPANHVIGIGAVDADDPAVGDDVWLTISGFTTPTTLARGELGSAAEPEIVRTSPARFNADNLEVTQHFATSDDGTRIPYFQVAPRDLVLDGQNPVFLDGYGGFEVSRTPGYAVISGIAWLNQTTDGTGALPAGRSGVYVLANIRGGGEYGPAWHEAARRENKQRSYEDFAAVARDLSDRGVGSADTIGASGGSNGGLLVGNMLTQYPELFGAISCGVPLLDMLRYTELSAGASWAAEYGDPATDDWDFIQHFSPYHLLDAAPRDEYPPVLFWTATSDDRVGPVQARKMAAKMQTKEIPDVWFFEDTQGGHSAASDNKQIAAVRALTYRFMWRALTGEDRND